MQHIHKHPLGMLAEMWKRTCGRTLLDTPISEVYIWFHLFHWSYGVLYSVTMSTFSLIVGGRGVLETEGLGVGELERSGEVNILGLAQRRSAVDEGSEALDSA